MNATSCTREGAIPCRDTTGAQLAGKQLCQDGPGDVSEYKPGMIRQCALAGNVARDYQGCINECVARRSREQPLYSSVVRLCSPVPSFDPFK